MKNKEFQKLLKKNKSKPNSNSGFTLTELLVGLIMSTIVIAGLGWGLINILRTTKTETSKVASRNETSRAFNFIADEVKASQAMEANESSTSYISATDLTTVASNFNLPIGAEVKLALQVPGVDQRIIYYVASSTGTWKKPLTIYRWGPNLSADGSYTDPTTPIDWQYEALIDGVSDKTLTADGCDIDGDGNDETYQGFFACVIDDDGDVDSAGNPLVENLTDTNLDGKIDKDDAGATDLNGDGVIDNGDGADVDGMSITAQLYFSTVAERDYKGDIKESYQTQSQVVARSRVAPLRKPELKEKKLFEVESLKPQYGRYIDYVDEDNNTPCWTVRNDFGQGNNPTARPGSGNELTNTMTWIHEDDRQPQPLNMNPSQPFTIVASAFGGLNPQCVARGNKYKRIWDDASGEYRYVDSTGTVIDPNTDDGTERVPADGSEEIHTYEHKVWHTIDFDDHNTFNGSDSTLSDPADVSRDATSNPPTEGQLGAGDVRIFKDGDNLTSNTDYDGYSPDNTGNGNDAQPSLKDFLKNKGYVDSEDKVVLKPNQRIIVFEIGQDAEGADNPNPGFDLQDNIFLMTSDAFNN